MNDSTLAELKTKLDRESDPAERENLKLQILAVRWGESYRSRIVIGNTMRPKQSYAACLERVAAR